MAIYEVEVYELHTVKRRVVASSAADAVAQIYQGLGPMIDDSLELIDCCYLGEGMHGKEYNELQDQLVARGFNEIDDQINGIRDIKQIEEEPPEVPDGSID